MTRYSSKLPRPKGSVSVTQCKEVTYELIITDKNHQQTRTTHKLVRLNNNSEKLYSFQPIKQQNNKWEQEKFEQALEIRHFQADCFRLLLRDRHPEVRSVWDENGNGIGMITEFYPGFTSLHQLAQEKRPVSKELFLLSRAPLIWAAEFVESKIDFDWGGETLGIVFGDGKSIPYFIKNSTRPIYVKCPLIKIFSAEVMNEANADVYMIILLRMLIPDDFYRMIAAATIRSSELRKKCANEKIEYTKALLQDFLSVTAFRQFVLDQKNFAEEATNYLEEFAENYEFKFDKKSIQTTFANIVDQVKAIKNPEQENKIDQEWNLIALLYLIEEFLYQTSLTIELALNCLLLLFLDENNNRQQMKNIHYQIQQTKKILIDNPGVFNGWLDHSFFNPAPPLASVATQDEPRVRKTL